MQRNSIEVVRIAEVCLRFPLFPSGDRDIGARWNAHTFVKKIVSLVHRDVTFTMNVDMMSRGG